MPKRQPKTSERDDRGGRGPWVVPRVRARARAWVYVCTSATLLALAMPAAADDPGAASEPLGAGTFDLALEFGGRTRTYWLHVPPHASGTPAEPLPLLLAFHGGGGKAEGYIRYAGLDAVADRERFLVAYPDGSGRLGRRLLTWNAGGCCGIAMKQGVDDVSFARAVVDDVARRVKVDRKRIYATGHSNGAMMSYRLAAEAPEWVAAIAPVAGAMSLTPFEGASPVPVLHIHSKDDPRALYGGGLGPPFPMTRNRVQHRPVETELGRWIALNGCPAEPQTLEQKREAKTGHTATHLRYAPCTSGATVELWRLTGAGHGWPGGRSGLSERQSGPETNVISAAEEVWRFVSRFERSEPTGTDEPTTAQETKP